MSALTDRIRAEFVELPGLKLTTAEACRLWSADERACDAAFAALIEEGFLRQTPSGAFIALPRPGALSLEAAMSEVAPRPARCPHCAHLNSLHVERTVTARQASTTFRCSACTRVVTVTEISA